MSNSKPLVSVVTPVYNGEAYLEECIQSVLNQTYQDWEYLIVNNCSTDNSLNIAKKFAKQDARIRIHENIEFLPIIENFNHTLRQISPNSKYCKIIHSDDLMLSDCIEKMVAVAELDSSIGIVSSYRLKSNKIDNSGLLYPQTVFSGKVICKSSLSIRSLPGRIYVFGSPSSLLIRSDLIRNRDPFYNAKYQLVLDQEVCYYMLQSSNFGFVHQVLTYSRVHDQQVTTDIDRHNRHIIEELMLIQEFGPIYFAEQEYKERFEQALDWYYKFLSTRILNKGRKELWKFQKKSFKKLNIRLNWFKLIIGITEALINRIIYGLFHPQFLAKRLLAKYFA